MAWMSPMPSPLASATLRGSTWSSPQRRQSLVVPASTPEAASGPDKAGDGFGGFLHLGVGLGAAGLDGLRHAVAEMVLDQAQGDRLQGPGHGGDLGEDVDAVGVVVDHALEPPHLALDPA